jgi:hypothetical protein
VATWFWVAALVAAALGATMLVRQLKHPTTSRAWWIAGMGGYAIAFVTQALTVDHGWKNPWVYRLYLEASAGLVGAMAVGTGYMVWVRPIARRHAQAMAGLMAALALSLVTDPVSLHYSWAQLDAGGRGIAGLPQLLYALIAGWGGTLVVLGALWSAWRLRRWALLAIALGALTSSAAGAGAASHPGASWFPWANVVGLILIAFGYEWASLQSRASAPSLNG